MSLDKSRIQKSLHTSHPNGFTPVLYQVQTEHEEAAFIAIEIKRLVAHMGGALNWGDFVILRKQSLVRIFSEIKLSFEVRFNALSRVIETALQKEGIPSRVLGGHKFFERLEVRCNVQLGLAPTSPTIRDRSKIFWHTCRLWITQTLFLRLSERLMFPVGGSGKRFVHQFSDQSSV